jgi:transcriptional regulator of arginine metabolism
MRFSRQSKILELISTQEVDTQNRLAELLRREGFEVTQATVSRDIKELNLVKVQGENGRSRYAQPSTREKSDNVRFRNILKEVVLSVTPAENLIVVKTVSGCGNAAAEAIDNSNAPGILGTLAGDNTVLVIVDRKDDVPAILDRFNEAIK